MSKNIKAPSNYSWTIHDHNGLNGREHCEHVHVFKHFGDWGEASFNIRTGEMIAGNFSNKECKVIQ